MKVAISGKGGVGKTTIAAGLIRYFTHLGYEVYAVDADPDASLGLALGLDEDVVAGLTPIVDLREEISRLTGGGGALYTLNPDVNALLERYALRQGRINFLKMGAVKQGGSSCYCRENSVLNALLNLLLLEKGQVVVLDMSAGIEHLTRGTARGVDVMLVVTEPTRASLQTARLVEKLAAELGVARVKFLGNKVRSEAEERILKASLPDEALLGVIPFDEDIWGSWVQPQPQEPPGLQKWIAEVAGLILSEAGTTITSARQVAPG